MADPVNTSETKNNIVPFLIIAVVVFLAWFFLFRNGNPVQIKAAAGEGLK